MPILDDKNHVHGIFVWESAQNRISLPRRCRSKLRTRFIALAHDRFSAFMLCMNLKLDGVHMQGVSIPNASSWLRVLDDHWRLRNGLPRTSDNSGRMTLALFFWSRAPPRHVTETWPSPASSRTCSINSCVMCTNHCIISFRAGVYMHKAETTPVAYKHHEMSGLSRYSEHRNPNTALISRSGQGGNTPPICLIRVEAVQFECVLERQVQPAGEFAHTLKDFHPNANDSKLGRSNQEKQTRMQESSGTSCKPWKSIYAHIAKYHTQIPCLPRFVASQ